VAGAFVIAGCWTPVTGSLLAIAELELALADPISVQSRLVLVGLGAGLAMAGPGAWSIDALLFGRRRIDIPDRHGRAVSPKRGAPKHHD
jgi:putative oxidoreductase